MLNDPNPYAPPPQIASQPLSLPAGVKAFAPCPACGNNLAKPVGYTWWGGLLGPKLFNHVKCTQCRTAYNGKSGRSNNTAIAVYLGVSVIVGGALGLLVLLG